MFKHLKVQVNSDCSNTLLPVDGAVTPSEFLQVFTQKLILLFKYEKIYKCSIYANYEKISK